MAVFYDWMTNSATATTWPWHNGNYPGTSTYRQKESKPLTAKARNQAHLQALRKKEVMRRGRT